MSKLSFRLFHKELNNFSYHSLLDSTELYSLALDIDTRFIQKSCKFFDNNGTPVYEGDFLKFRLKKEPNKLILGVIEENHEGKLKIRTDLRECMDYKIDRVDYDFSELIYAQVIGNNLQNKDMIKRRS